MLPRSSTPRNFQPEVGERSMPSHLWGSPSLHPPSTPWLRTRTGVCPRGDASGRGESSSGGCYENRPLPPFPILMGSRLEVTAFLIGQALCLDIQVKARMPSGTSFPFFSASHLHSHLQTSAPTLFSAQMPLPGSLLGWLQVTCFERLP